MRNYNYLIKSVMLGHAVGDALGVPVEFCTREELDKNTVTDMRGFGTYPYPAGTWSDDTSMSLCTLEAMSHEDWNLSRIMDNFVKWINDGEFTPTGECFDVGKTTYEAIRRYLNGCNQHECGGADEYDNGNGSLMRIHPVSLYTYIHKINDMEWFAYFDNICALTHAHDRAKAGCLIYATVFSVMMMDPSKEKIREGIEFASRDLSFLPEIEHYNRLFSPNFEKLPREEIKSGGYVVDTLEAALWCVLTTDSYRECVLKAVNLGGDTDTVADIAGGLAGALYGYDAIPKEWLDTLAKRGYIEDLCDRAGKMWSYNAT